MTTATATKAPTKPATKPPTDAPTDTPADAPAEVRRATIVGNLTRDPELRFSAKGTPWATASVAVNHRRRDEAGTWVDEEPEFYSLVAFGETAEHVADSLRKGDRVIVVGRLEDETWTDRNGVERATTKLIADEVGASLRFADLSVSKAPRTVHASGGDNPGYDREPTDDEEPF
jgi:single-strand DNA-binding protein